jgi:hypothetical protein
MMRTISTARIKEICSKVADVEDFIVNHHPNKLVANRAVNLMNDNAITSERFSSKGSDKFPLIVSWCRKIPSWLPRNSDKKLLKLMIQNSKQSDKFPMIVFLVRKMD